jgi:hypothetical protein
VAPDLLRTLRHAIAFDRMAAIQLRRIAEMEPELADKLQHIADQLEADAAEMERHLPEDPLPPPNGGDDTEQPLPSCPKRPVPVPRSEGMGAAVRPLKGG